MVPLPDAARHSILSPAQNGQMARGYQCALPQAMQTGTTKRLSRAASQNACVSMFTIGEGILRDSAIVSLPLHDECRAAMARAELHTGALRQGEITILDLH